MQRATKAALLSALVFPGVGHLYLKRFGRGLVILLSALGSLGVMVWMAMVSLLSRLDSNLAMIRGSGVGIPPLPSLGDLQASDSAGLSNAVSILLLCCWLFAVIDAYRIGKEKDRPPPAVP